MAKIIKPQKRMYYYFHFDGVDYKGDKWEIAEQIGRSINQVSHYISRPTETRYGHQIGTKWPIYDYYRGKSGKYVGTGTVAEIMERLNVTYETASYGSNFKKLFTGKYKIVEDEDMITRRTINKVAPVPVPEKYEPERKIKVVTTRPVEMREFKFKDKWINYQLSGMFRNWGEV